MRTASTSTFSDTEHSLRYACVCVCVCVCCVCVSVCFNRFFYGACVHKLYIVGNMYSIITFAVGVLMA